MAILIRFVGAGREDTLDAVTIGAEAETDCVEVGVEDTAMADDCANSVDVAGVATMAVDCTGVEMEPLLELAIGAGAVAIKEEVVLFVTGDGCTFNREVVGTGHTTVVPDENDDSVEDDETSADTMGVVEPGGGVSMDVDEVLAVWAADASARTHAVAINKTKPPAMLCRWEPCFMSL